MQSIYIYKSEFVRFVAPSDLSRRPTLSEKILMRRVIVLNNAFNMELFYGYAFLTMHYAVRSINNA